MKTKKLTTIALLSSLALILGFIEGQFVIIPACPGIKLGLSNTAVMFTLLFMDKKSAYSIAVLKALFAFATRGIMAGILSLSGGLVSISVILIILLLNKNTSFASLSITGALFHNLAQFTVIHIVYRGASFLPYLPLLIVSGIVFGVMNALLLKTTFPYLKKVIK